MLTLLVCILEIEAFLACSMVCVTGTRLLASYTVVGLPNKASTQWIPTDRCKANTLNIRTTQSPSSTTTCCRTK
ncbi:hypothetical protein BJX62DRAFT_196799 [Aspergillus germanicus]